MNISSFQKERNSRGRVNWFCIVVWKMIVLKGNLIFTWGHLSKCLPTISQDYLWQISEIEAIPSGHRSTSQCWINVEPQLSSTILNVDIRLRNCWFCNNDQPKINFSTTIQPKINQVWSWNINVEKWLIFGWQLVDFRLGSWFLVDHCYKINDFSTKYQRWYLVEKLICAHRVSIPLSWA